MTTCIWQNVCAALESTLSKPALGLLLPGLELAGVDGQRVTLRAESGFFREMVIRKFLATFQAAFESVLGFEPVFSWEISEKQKSNINNINNINNLYNNNQENINNINQARDYSGLKRKVNSDSDFILLLDSWGVGKPFVYAAMRDFGEMKVKGIVFRLRNLQDGYFRQDYGPVPEQRGRLFNFEIRKLRECARKI